MFRGAMWMGLLLESLSFFFSCIAEKSLNYLAKKEKSLNCLRKMQMFRDAVT
jgi:hypothetical protein